MNETCRHINWYVGETSPFGKVLCKDCGKEMWASDAINNTSEYLQSLIKELEAIISTEVTKKPGRPKKDG